MIRERVVASLLECAIGLGKLSDGTQWQLFGSVDRNEAGASDIDLMILCRDDQQADSLRQSIDCDAFFLPLHLAFMTYEEAAEVAAAKQQKSHVIYDSR